MKTSTSCCECSGAIGHTLCKVLYKSALRRQLGRKRTGPVPLMCWLDGERDALCLVMDAKSVSMGVLILPRGDFP